jgi:hypothetical protein
VLSHGKILQRACQGIITVTVSHINEGREARLLKGQSGIMHCETLDEEEIGTLG